MTTLQPDELVLRVFVNGESRPLVVGTGCTFADVIRLVGGSDVAVEEVWRHCKQASAIADMKPTKSNKYHSISVADISPYQPDIIIGNRYSSNDNQLLGYHQNTDIKATTLKVAGKYANRGENARSVGAHQHPALNAHQNPPFARAAVDHHRVNRGAEDDRRQHTAGWRDTHDQFIVGLSLDIQTGHRPVSASHAVHQVTRQNDSSIVYQTDSAVHAPQGIGLPFNSEHGLRTYYNPDYKHNYVPHNYLDKSSHRYESSGERMGNKVYESERQTPSQPPATASRATHVLHQAPHVRPYAHSRLLVSNKPQQEVIHNPTATHSKLINTDNASVTNNRTTHHYRQQARSEPQPNILPLLADTRDGEIGDVRNQPITEEMLQRNSTADVHVLRIELRKQYEEMQLRELKLKTELADTERRRNEIASLEQQVMSLMTSATVAARGVDKKRKPMGAVSKVKLVSMVDPGSVSLQPVGTVSRVATVEPFNVSVKRQHNENVNLSMKTPGKVANDREVDDSVREERALAIVGTSRTPRQHGVSADSTTEQIRSIADNSLLHSNIRQNTEAVMKATESLRKSKSNFNYKNSHQDQIEGVNKRLLNQVEENKSDFLVNGNYAINKAATKQYFPFGQQLTRSQSQFDVSSTTPASPVNQFNKRSADTQNTDQWYGQWKSSSPPQHYSTSVHTESSRSLLRSFSSTCLPATADSYTHQENKKAHVTIVNLHDKQDDFQFVTTSDYMQQDQCLPQMLDQLELKDTQETNMLNTARTEPTFKQSLVPVPLTVTGGQASEASGHLLSLPNTAFFSPLTVRTTNSVDEPSGPSNLYCPLPVHGLVGHQTNTASVGPRSPGLHTFASVSAINQTYTATRRPPRSGKQHTAAEQSSVNTSAVNTLWSVISRHSHMTYTEAALDEIKLAMAETGVVSERPQEVMPLDKTATVTVASKGSPPTHASHTKPSPMSALASPHSARLQAASYADPELSTDSQDVQTYHFSGPVESKLTILEDKDRDIAKRNKDAAERGLRHNGEKINEEEESETGDEKTELWQDVDVTAPWHTEANEEVREGSPVNVTCHQLMLRKKREPDGEVKRVSFDPLSLLLDACLQGELDLIKSTLTWVSNISAANDEGTTALHNAVTGNQYDVATFLIEQGCAVNVADGDGWTPLHCAAHTNNVALVKLLVEHGACVFAMTALTGERPVHKCMTGKPSADECIAYLSDAEHQLGVINDGVVYATCTYRANNNDELSVTVGEKLRVLRRGDETERLWWWVARGARGGGGTQGASEVQEQGYIACNLLTAHELHANAT